MGERLQQEQMFKVVLYSAITLFLPSWASDCSLQKIFCSNFFYSRELKKNKKWGVININFTNTKTQFYYFLIYIF